MNIVSRMLVLLKAAPTYLVAASTVVAAFRDQIVTLLPPSWQGPAAAATVSVLAFLASAVAIVRSVTPVMDEFRGLLAPTPGQVPPDA